MAEKPRILFICQHNSGRSQMAEAFLKRLAGDRLEVASAGLEPAPAVNPLVVKVMQEEGIDLTAARPQSVFELFKAGRLFDQVITVCSDTENRCPIFPGIAHRLHRPFPDPAKAEGTEGEKLAQVRRIRDAIRNWIENPAEGAFDNRWLGNS
jgi:arsenate reductase